MVQRNTITINDLSILREDTSAMITIMHTKGQNDQIRKTEEATTSPPTTRDKDKLTITQMINVQES